MAHDDLYFRLRIPAPLKDRVTASATGNHRSTTAEIIAVLERAFPDLPHIETASGGGGKLVAEILTDVEQLKAKLQRLRGASWNESADHE